VKANRIGQPQRRRQAAEYSQFKVVSERFRHEAIRITRGTSSHVFAGFQVAGTRPGQVIRKLGDVKTATPVVVEAHCGQEAGFRGHQGDLSGAC